MPLADSLRLLCCAVRKPDVDSFTEAKEIHCAQPVRQGPTRASTVDLSSSQLLFQLHCSAHTEGSWLSRIGTCLSACKLALHIADVRLMLFGGETLAAWVLTEVGGAVLADGWGRLCGELADQADSIAVIRDALRPAGCWLYGSRPDPAAVVCRPSNKPLRLAPGELLVLPVRQGSRLAAALVLGFGAGCDGKDASSSDPDGTTTPSSTPPPRPPPACGTRVLDSIRKPESLRQFEPADLADLHQLARILVLAILGAEPNHARFLSKAADHLGQLPLCQSLSGLMGGLLAATQELLALRFSIQLLPVLALTHGASGGGRAVLFTQRAAAGGAGAAALSSAHRGVGGGGDSLLETYASVQSLSALAVSSAGPRSTTPYRTASGLSVHVDRANSVTEGASPGVKAVKVALPNTLLSEALRARSGSAALGSGGGGDGGGGAITSYGQQQQQESQQPQQQQRFSSLILRNAGGFVLDEQQPCRDILIIGKLLGGAVGSLVLCLEARQAAATATAATATAATATATATATARKGVDAGGGGGGGAAAAVSGGLPSVLGRLISASYSRGGGGGGSPLQMPTAAITAALAAEGPANDGGGGGGGASTATAAAAELQEAADAMLFASPVFALYLVSADTLPYSVLEAVVHECKLLLGLFLDAVRVSVAAGGRAAAELRTLQQQLLDQGGGGGGPLALAAQSQLSLERMASASASATISAAQPNGPAVGKAVKRIISGHVARLKSSQECPVAGPTWRPGSGHVAGFARQGSATAAAGRVNTTAAQLLMSGAGGGLDLFDRELGAPQEGALQRWMLASSPELTLEAAPGPSQLEVLVSTMRSHLGTAIAEAETAHEARSVVAEDMAALDLHEMIGRGGQGVVFKGLLHGLETAIKLNVCRDGEPLEDDEPGGAAADKAPVGYDMDGIVSTADWEEQGARLRKVKRGAMEHAIMPTLSHPNIVQVYATFSNVVTVKCTYRGERQPRLRLCSRDDAILLSTPNQGGGGPLNQVICFEYCDCGTLLDAAQAGAFRPPGASAFTAIARPALIPLYMSLLEVALALRYLHSRRLVHCDLKPANVLLKGSNRDVRGWTCKLSDFGCARLMTEMAPPLEPSGAAPQHHRNNSNEAATSPPPPLLGFRMAAPLGTVAYMAPGILMYELLTCRAPYAEMSPSDVPRKVVRCHLRPEFHPLAPTDYCSLASRCWSASPRRRPTASDLVSEIEKLLKSARRSEERRQGQVSLTMRQGGRSAAATASAPPPPRPTSDAGPLPPPPPPPPPPPLPSSAGLRPDPPGRVLLRPPAGRLVARFDEHPVAAARDDYLAVAVASSQTLSAEAEGEVAV
ncbi:hypothetical protein PLESTM_001190700 [Pleodorina starrii]|nr:hypothetical protein PLESTM_001190700 [Pleodorina starrii]